MDIPFRRLDVVMPHQFLHYLNVRALLQQFADAQAGGVEDAVPGGGRRPDSGFCPVCFHNHPFGV